jgi:hypothetical protein
MLNLLTSAYSGLNVGEGIMIYTEYTSYCCA